MKPRALFIYTHLSTFVEGDRKILEEHYNIESYRFKNSPKVLLLLSLLKELLFLLLTLHRYRLVYIWFADYHSWLPTLLGKLYRKEVVLIAGGYDIAREKKYRYGSFSKRIRALLTLRSLERASQVWAVSNYLLRGIRAIAPKANSYLLYNGIEERLFLLKREIEKSSEADSSNQATAGLSKRERVVLSVALANSRQSIYIKGIDRYFAVATTLPNIKFILIGSNRELLKSVLGAIPPNIEVIEPIAHSKLALYYQNSHIYCQLSRRESFSLSLAEAMWHNAIPVVSAVGGMPEVVGKMGEIVYLNDHPLLYGTGILKVAQAIESSIERERESGCQKRIAQNFTLSLRKKRVGQLLNLK
ncbi:MAG: glycosyltransferase family 4 protein [Bacteroidales bacterium]